MTTNKNTRRDFLRGGVHASMLGALSSLGLLSAGPAQAQATGYKALVCLYLFGGNDGNNMIVPLDAQRSQAYKAIRGSSGLALSLADKTLVAARSAKTQAVLQPVTQEFAFHYGMPELDALYGQGKVAAVLNVGSLHEPMTRDKYLAGTALPPQLFSHPDQTLQNLSGSAAATGTGWGGRLVDLLGSGSPLDAVTLGGGGLFVEGANTHGNQIPANGQLRLAGMDFWPQKEADVRHEALRAILGSDNPNKLQAAANRSLLNGMDLANKLSAASGGAPFATPFPPTELGAQFKTVAQLIRMGAQQNSGRQVYFVSLGGFDTHTGQSFQQFDMLRRVSQAVAAFQLALAEFQAEDKVTTFTMSDFGRTLVPNSGGTDHAWGNHQLVIGGGVKGGLYGNFPSFELNKHDDATGRGVWVPQFSNQQLGATLGQWFGAHPADLDVKVFKGELSRFALPDLGFMT
ncbi:MAG TPA: DUF1501 domain-containing protein [Burkholderiaceae bacterium]